MHDAAGTGAGAGIRLSYDGRVHVLASEDRSWEVRLELEQRGAGEIVGVGSTRRRSTPVGTVSART